MTTLPCADATASAIAAEVTVQSGSSGAAATPSTCADDAASTGTGGCWRACDSRRASLLLPRCLWTDDETTEAGSGKDSESPKETLNPVLVGDQRDALVSREQQLPQPLQPSEPVCNADAEIDNGGDGECSGDDATGDDDFDLVPDWSGKTPVIRYMTRTPNAASPSQSLVWVQPDIVKASHAKGAPPLRLYRLEWDVSNVTAIPTVFAVGDMLVSPPFHTDSDLATLYIGLLVAPTGPEDLRGITKQTARRATTRFEFAIRVTSTSDCSARLGVRINGAYSGPLLHRFRNAPWTPAANFGSAASLLAPGENTLRVLVEVYDVSSSASPDDTSGPKSTTAEDVQTAFRRMTLQAANSSRNCDSRPLPTQRRMTDGCYKRTEEAAAAADVASSAVAAALAATTMERKLRNSQSLADLLAAVSAAVEAERRDAPPFAAADPVSSALLPKAVAQTLLALGSDVDLMTAERFMGILCSIITLHSANGVQSPGVLPSGFFSGLALCVDHLRSKNNWQALMQLNLLLATPGSFFASQLTVDQSAWVNQLLCSSTCFNDTYEVGAGIWGAPQEGPDSRQNQHA